MADPDRGAGGGGGGGRPGHPDPDMGGGGGLKIFFQPFEPQFGLKIRGEPRPRAPPLDPPQFKASRTFFEVGFFLLICKRTSTGYPHDVVTCRSRRWLVLVVFTEAAKRLGKYASTSHRH